MVGNGSPHRRLSRVKHPPHRPALRFPFGSSKPAGGSRFPLGVVGGDGSSSDMSPFLQAWGDDNPPSLAAAAATPAAAAAVAVLLHTHTPEWLAVSSSFFSPGRLTILPRMRQRSTCRLQHDELWSMKLRRNARGSTPSATRAALCSVAVCASSGKLTQVIVFFVRLRPKKNDRLPPLIGSSDRQRADDVMLSACTLLHSSHGHAARGLRTRTCIALLKHRLIIHLSLSS